MIHTVIGIDGGGTYSRGVLLQIPNLNILSYAVEGPVNYHNIGLDKVRENLLKLFSSLIQGIKEEIKIEYITIGLPAMNTEIDRVRLRSVVSELFRGYRFRIEHDVHIALYAATRGGNGILVVAGTGCNVYGYLNGKKYYAGNWGWKIGDEGSSYRVARDLALLALKEYDGRLEDSGILKAILDYLNLKNFDVFLDWIYHASVDEIAKLSILACYLSQYNRAVYNIIKGAAQDLVSAVAAVWKKMGNPKIELYYMGGLFNCRLFKETFINSIRLAGGMIDIRDLKVNPIVGAVLISLHSIGLDADPINLDRKIKRYIEEIY